MNGRVYFAHTRAGGPIKIGFTADLKNRIKALASYSYQGLEVITTIPGYRLRESFLKTALAPWCGRNEWFCSCVPVWRVIIEAHDCGDLSWMPADPDFVVEWIPRKPVAPGYFDKTLAAQNALARELGFPETKRWSSSELLGEYRFLVALRRGELPKWLADAHSVQADAAVPA